MPFGGFIGNVSMSKLLPRPDDQLDGVERVGAEIVLEFRFGLHFSGVDVKFAFGKRSSALSRRSASCDHDRLSETGRILRFALLRLGRLKKVTARRRLAPADRSLVGYFDPRNVSLPGRACPLPFKIYDTCIGCTSASGLPSRFLEMVPLGWLQSVPDRFVTTHRRLHRFLQAL